MLHRPKLVASCYGLKPDRSVKFPTICPLYAARTPHPDPVSSTGQALLPLNGRRDLCPNRQESSSIAGSVQAARRALCQGFLHPFRDGADPLPAGGTQGLYTAFRIRRGRGHTVTEMLLGQHLPGAGVQQGDLGCQQAGTVLLTGEGLLEVAQMEVQYQTRRRTLAAATTA